MTRKRAVVVVLGDIGRSPRMCYHAYSLATQLDYAVTIVGYYDSTPHEMITENENISIQPIKSPPAVANVPEALQMLIKLIWTFFFLLYTLLFKIGGIELILMQNPPGVPTMPVCWLAAKIKGARFVIDWHNYMYSVLKDKYGLTRLSFEKAQDEPQEAREPSKEQNRRRRTEKFAPPVVRKKKTTTEKKEGKSFRQMYVEWIYRFENFFGQMADAGFCVTKAMRMDLYTRWNVPAAVFYDRPPSWTFGNTTLEEKHELFMRLGREYKVFDANDDTNENRFTQKSSNGEITWKADRPLIVMSSTSWTPDEDFSILLEAVLKYNNVARINWSDSPEKCMPSILLIITGRGPMKDFYMEKIARMNMDKVQVITPWLEAADYPRLLAAADIGVSLHTSTSGLDLPMKVVDMFGSDLPALAKKFACISELVVEGKNGHLFDSANELADHLVRLATGFPTHCTDLIRLKETTVEERLVSWEENWATNAKVILEPRRNEALERTLANEPESDSDSDAE